MQTHPSHLHCTRLVLGRSLFVTSATSRGWRCIQARRAKQTGWWCLVDEAVKPLTSLPAAVVLAALPLSSAISEDPIPAKPAKVSWVPPSPG